MHEHKYVNTNGIRMHYVCAGSGPVVILLHGFPEFWYSWRYQLSALADAGFRAVAPDLRGWGDTDKPRGVAAYRLDRLVGDIEGLRAALGVEQIHLVGHDWGGGVAWAYAAAHPQRVGRLSILNAPHPAALLHTLRHSGLQRLKSWYMLFFQIPWLPEALSRLVGYANIRRELTRTVNPAALSAEDLARYMANIRQPRALTAGMNYYRAAFRSGLSAMSSMPAIQAETLLIWGRQDPYLIPEGAEACRAFVPNLTIRYIETAGHWVQMEAPDLVSEYLIAFLR